MEHHRLADDAAAARGRTWTDPLEELRQYSTPHEWELAQQKSILLPAPPLLMQQSLSSIAAANAVSSHQVSALGPLHHLHQKEKHLQPQLLPSQQQAPMDFSAIGFMNQQQQALVHSRAASYDRLHPQIQSRPMISSSLLPLQASQFSSSVDPAMSSLGASFSSFSFLPNASLFPSTIQPRTLFLANGPSFGNFPANVQWVPQNGFFQPVIYNHPFEAKQLPSTSSSSNLPVATPGGQTAGADQASLVQQQDYLQKKEWFGK